MLESACVSTDVFERECVCSTLLVFSCVGVSACESVKAMRKPENSVILCSVEINLNGITTVGNLTKINCTSETRKLHGNLTEILTEMLNGNGTRNKYEISGMTGNNLEITKRNGNSGQNFKISSYTRRPSYTRHRLYERTSLIWNP